MKPRLFFYILFLTSINLFAQTYYLTQDSLNSVNTISLDTWKFNSADSPEFKKVNLNDSNWQKVNSRFQSREINWLGKGWFRAELNIDSSLLNIPLGILIWHSGKSQLYLNGNLIAETDQENYEKRRFIQYPIPLHLNKTRNQFALRYEIDFYDIIEEHNIYSGFYFRIDNYGELLDQRVDLLSGISSKKIIFMTIGFVLLFLHLTLYLFNRENVQNLYYSIFIISFIAFVHNNYSSSLTRTIIELIKINSLGMFPLLMTILFGAATMKSFYKPIVMKHFVIMLLAAIVLSTIRIFINEMFIWYIAYAFIIFMSIWGSYNLYNRKYKRELGGDRILITGFALFGALGFYQMIIALNIVENPLFGIYDPFIYGILIFTLAMSITLSRDFAVTNINLKSKLIQVKELSEKNLKQEIEKKILEADNKRKTKELEEAREFQLSLLPKELPNLKNVNVSARMLTATEVGGDYYDYFIKGNKLTVVIGDATGHGTKAGNMVVAIKSLFNSISPDENQLDFFNRCNKIIKNMQMDKMYMALTLVNIEENKVSISSAGMPQILYFNSSKNELEEILLKGMPIGAVNNFPYAQYNLEVSQKDFLFLYSDGIIEQFNEKKEMFGIERLKEIVLSSVKDSPELLFDKLIDEVNIWKGENPQQDDITFMAIKFPL
jgi:serine phosphatase RsbU (regulator of sigma subunit)